MKEKLRPLPFVVLTLTLGLTLQLHAAPGAISINAPDFIIPVGGQSGTLDLFSDGRAPETSGFNALGKQRLTLQGNSVSAGMLTLNLHFSGFPLGEGAAEVNGAALRVRVRDLDFMGDRVGPGAMLRETAVLSSINGVPLAAPMPLASYLPEGTTHTDNNLLALDPLLLRGSALPASFAGPLVLSFTLTATLTTGSLPITMVNTPENISSDVSLTVVPQTVPEPSTAALLGVGGLWLAFALRRRR